MNTLFFRNKSTDTEDLPWIDTDEKVSYTSSILEENLVMQQSASSALRSNLVRRKKSDRGVQASQVRA